MMSYRFFDYVHMLKCIHNNWMTEDCSELSFSHESKVNDCKLEYFEKFYEHEKMVLSSCQLDKMYRYTRYPLRDEKLLIL